MPSPLSPLYFVVPIAIALSCIALRGNRPPEIIQGIATLLGIGGTFGGIVYALAGLDFNNLNTSIPHLLNGIYPAFYSSLAGVSVSLLVYFFPKFWKQKEETVNEGVDIDSQILQELREMNKSISGDSETSLSTQMIKLKDAITDKQSELKKSFDMFAEKVADNNMNALREVIEKFNIELQTQFGENFKQLNQAVGALLDWQEQYKETIEKTNAKIDSMLHALEASKDSLYASSRALEKITESANTFKETSEALQKHLEEVRNTMGALNDFARQLEGKGDAINEEMKKIVEGTLQGLGENMKSLSAALVRDYQKIFSILERINNEAKESITQ